MPRSRLVFVLLLVLLLGAAGGVVVLGTMPAPAPVTPVDSPAALSADERRFYEDVAPALRAAAVEARSLATQGQERSRNIFAIRAGQDRLEGHLRTLDAALASPVPARFAAVPERYRPAAADIRAAIRQAESAFLRFDWDSVSAATELMAAGTAQLETAVSELDEAAGVSTGDPATSTRPSRRG